MRGARSVSQKKRANPSIAFLALVLLASAVAQPSGADPGPAPRAPANAAAALRSTMTLIAGRVAADLGSTAKDPAVFVAQLRSDEPAPRGAELASKLGALVAGALGTGASARPEPVALATAQAMTRGAKWLVYVQAEVARGQLQINADAYRATHSVWERARQPTPAPVAHGFASGRIDGEVRAYLGPVPLVANRVDRIGLDERDVVAIACGDVGDGGGLEVVTLSRRRVTIGRARGGRFVPRESAALRELSGIAPAPLREPVGGVAIVTPPGRRAAYIDVGITDRARGSRLDVDLHPVGSVAGVPFATPNGDACTTFQGSTLDAGVTKCADADPPLDPSDIDTPLDTGAAASYVTADGAVRTILATRDPRTAELKVRADGKTASLPGAGAQVAVADLDQDGAPEVISTLDVLPQSPSGQSDALVISTWQPDGSLRERTRMPVPSGIRAVAACPPEGGQAAVVLATQGELWIVR